VLVGSVEVAEVALQWMRGRHRDGAGEIQSNVDSLESSSHRLLRGELQARSLGEAGFVARTSGVPHRSDRVEDERTGSLQSGVGPRERHLGGGVARDRLESHGTQPGLGQRGEFVQCTPANTQRKSVECQARQGEERQSPECARLWRWLVERADRVRLGDDHVSYVHVVAARSAQAENVPVVDNLRIGARDQRQSPVAVAVWQQTRRVVLEDKHSVQEPFGVSTTTGKWPSTSNCQAASTGRGRSAHWGEH
jgi:hypothetical protein